jgi:hypothetical protein
MKLRQYSTWSNIIGIGGTILMLGFLYYILRPVFIPLMTGTPKTLLLSNMKQIGTSIAIYVSDYDGLFPTYYTRSEINTVLEPYLKNRTFLEPISPGFNQAPEYNYNFAGVNIENTKGILLADKINYIEPAKAIMVYSIILKKDHPAAVFTYADTHVNYSRKNEPFNPADIFAPQFDRTGTLLQGQKATK